MTAPNYIYIFLHPPRSGGESFTKFISDHLSPEESLGVDNLTLSSLTKERKRKIKFVFGHTSYYGIHKLFPNKTPKYFTVIRDPSEWYVSLYHSRMMDFPENKKQSFERWYSLKKRNDMTLYFDEVFREKDDSVRLQFIIKKNLRRVLDRIDRSKRLHTLLKSMRKKEFKKDKEKIILQNAKKLLDECLFVSITENLRNDIIYVCKLMGIKPDTKKFQVRSNIVRKLFKLDKKTKHKIYTENPLDSELYKYALKLNKEKKAKLRNLV